MHILGFECNRRNEHYITSVARRASGDAGQVVGRQVILLQYVVWCRRVETCNSHTELAGTSIVSFSFFWSFSSFRLSRCQRVSYCHRDMWDIMHHDVGLVHQKEENSAN